MNGLYHHHLFILQVMFGMRWEILITTDALEVYETPTMALSSSAAAEAAQHQQQQQQRQ